MKSFLSTAVIFRQHVGLVRFEDLGDQFLIQPVAIAFAIFDERDLRVAPRVEMADLMDTLDGTRGRAPFFGVILAVHIGVRVFEERNTGRAALLRAPTHDAVLVNI